jgi:hypothetical protein
MTRTPWEEPPRWTERAEGSSPEERLGVALRAAAAATLARVPTFALQAPLATVGSFSTPTGRGWLFPALAVAALTLGGAVAAAQVIRAARLAAFTRIEVPRGSTVSLVNRRSRRMRLVGPIAVSGDGDRIAISGEGEVRVEAGEEPLEIRPPTGGSVIQLAPGTSWPPAAQKTPEPDEPRLEPGPSGPPAPGPLLIATPGPPAPPVRVLGARPLRTAVALTPPALAPPALAPPAFAGRAVVAPAWPSAGQSANAAARDGDEAALVASMFRALHTERDPARALALAESHARAFPSGELSVEATAARVEALLALGRRPQALEILDGVSDEAAATSPARTLLRGELRLAAGRCAEALHDFAAVESARAVSGTNDLGSRALVGHATCSAQLGDLIGAGASFARYLQILPRGPAAGEARRFLSAHPVGNLNGTFRPPATLEHSEKEPQ